MGKILYSMFALLTHRGCSTISQDAQIHGVDKIQNKAEIIWTNPICVQQDRYIGWLTVCRRASGELIAVFSGDRDEHVCPYGKLQMVRSFDNGHTWTSPETLANSLVDDRDAGIVELPDGRLVVWWFTSFEYGNRLSRSQYKHTTQKRKNWQAAIDNLNQTQIDESVGNWVMVSTSDARKWSKPVRLTAFAPHGGILLSDGRLLYAGKQQVGRNYSGEKIIIFDSFDGGKTWNEISNIKLDRPNQYYEPHVGQTASGKLIMQVRCHIDYYLRQSESLDGGKTWTPLRKLEIKGYPAHLLRLKDGTMLTAYCRRDADGGEFACLSYDEGKTWDVKNEIRLSRGEYFSTPQTATKKRRDGDWGYPSTAQLDDDTFITVYYQERDSSLNEKPCLMATKWKLRKQ